MTEKQPFTKKLLRQILRVSNSTLYRELKKIKPKLLLKFPNYDENRKILPDDLFYWLLEQMGVDKEAALKRIIEIYHRKEKNDYESLKNYYGLNHENPIYSNRNEPEHC